MRTGVRIAAFLLGLGVLFGAAYGIGMHAGHGDDDRDTYSLRLAAVTATGESPVPLSFDVLDGDGGDVVTDFVVRHEKPLHLIAVRTDFAGYRHLHPTMDQSGRWTVETMLEPGVWRLYADFQPAGGDLQVASADLDVGGPGRADGGAGGAGAADPGVRTWTDASGYSVQASGDLAAGSEQELTFRVLKDGLPVTDLEPYLGSYGHLVVIGADLGYQHAHPLESPAGPEIPFRVAVPEQSTYHLFVDFQHGGTVRTATFALNATAAAPGSAPGESDHAGHGGSDHGDH